MNNTQTKNGNPVQTGEQTQPVKQVPVAPTPTSAQPINTGASEGVNLIPTLTKEEKTHVKRKNTLNIGSILSIIALASVAIAIVGFNIVSKSQLNSKQSDLKKVERSVKGKIDKMISNNIILDRVMLYKKVKENSFSHKEIIEYFMEMASKVSGVTYDSIEISENLDFELSGKGPDLEQVARLWYLYGVDENIESVLLTGVSKSAVGSVFNFKGKLILENFKNE
jgi:hypothetical protein